MHTGIITSISERESGMIKRTDKKEDIFFHSDALVGLSFKALRAGDKVAFEMVESNKGPYATRVSKA